ncbi:MAG: hypothetical protein WB290_16260, partial [Smithella sp.]
NFGIVIKTPSQLAYQPCMLVPFQSRRDCITAAKILEMVWSENPTHTMTINSTNYLIVRCLYHFYHTSPDTNIHMFLCQHYVRALLLIEGKQEKLN